MVVERLRNAKNTQYFTIFFTIIELINFYMFLSEPILLTLFNYLLLIICHVNLL